MPNFSRSFINKYKSDQRFITQEYRNIIIDDICSLSNDICFERGSVFNAELNADIAKHFVLEI